MHDPNASLEGQLKKLMFRQLMESFYKIEFKPSPIVFMTGKGGLDLFDKYVTDEFNKL